MKANARVKKMLVMAEQLRMETGADAVEVRLNCSGDNNFSPFAHVDLVFDCFGSDDAPNEPAGSSRG